MVYLTNMSCVLQFLIPNLTVWLMIRNVLLNVWCFSDFKVADF